MELPPEFVEKLEDCTRITSMRAY